MAWNAPGDNDPQDPWKKNSRNGQSDLEKQISEFFSKFLGENNSPQPNSNFIIALILGLIAIWALSGIYIVDEKERAVVLRFGKYEKTEMPGLRWKMRFIDEVKIINVTQVTPFAHKVTMLTEDENIVDVQLSVQYRVDDPKSYWLAINEPVVALKHATEAALRHVVGTSKMDKILTEGKEEVALDIRDMLRTYMSRYKTGIVVDRVNIEDAQPPAAVRESFDDVVKASEDKVRIINQAQTYRNGLLPVARGEAQSQLEAAEAYKQKLIAEAEGESQRFSKLLAEYRRAPKVTRQRLYLESIENVMDNSSKVMIDVKSGNNMMYLPLDKIIDQSKTSKSEPQKSSVTAPSVNPSTSSSAQSKDAYSRSSRIREVR